MSREEHTWRCYNANPVQSRCKWRFLLVYVTLAITVAMPNGAAAQGAAPNGLEFSTFLAGSGIDLGHAVAVDEQGGVYVAGATSSRDFPVYSSERPFRGGPAGFDVYVARFAPEGALVYSTYLGGGGDDVATSIVADRHGRACVAGATTSNDLPVTQHTLHGYRGGDLLGSDGFVACLSPDGSRIEYATYLGGSGDEAVSGLSIGADGSLFLAGGTSSADFPTTAGAAQPAFGGGLALRTDGFVARLRPDGMGFTLAYATYLGGSMDDAASDVDSDADGRVYIGGFTNSFDFPTRDPLQASFAGPMRALEGDAFVTSLSPDGSTIEFSTFLGGGGNDQATGLVLDSSGQVYVSGWTDSRDFPTTSGDFQAATRGQTNAFIAKLAPSGSGRLALSYSSLVGGSGNEAAHGIAIDAGGRIFLAGSTTSADLPLRGALQAGSAGRYSDGFVALMDSDGTDLEFSTYLGGSFTDAIHGIATGPSGRVCVTGSTASGDYPMRSPFLGVPSATSSPGTPETAFLTCMGHVADPVSVEETLEAPQRFALHTNYPNPFNPHTSIQFDVRESRSVRLVVYDVTGRRIATIVDATYAPGRFTALVDATGWASGVYFYRLDAGDFQQTRKMVLVR